MTFWHYIPKILIAAAKSHRAQTFSAVSCVCCVDPTTFSSTVRSRTIMQDINCGARSRRCEPFLVMLACYRCRCCTIASVSDPRLAHEVEYICELIVPLQLLLKG